MTIGEAVVHHHLRYSRAKLWATVLILAACAALFLALFIHPDFRVGGLYGALISGSLGHFVTLPLFTLFCAVFAIRLATIAAGPGDAVAAGPRGLRITKIWRAHVIAWSDLQHVDVVTWRFRRRDHFSMRFHRRDGAAISLPLGIITLSEDEYEAAVQTLMHAHRNATSPPAGGPKPLAATSAAAFPQAGQSRPTFGRRRGQEVAGR